MKKACALVVITGLVSTQVVYSGDISGTIILKGTPPPEQENTMIKADPYCGPLHKESVKTRHYVVGAKQGLGNVFVTIKGMSGKSTGAAAAPVVLDQKGCEYQPYVFAVQTSQKIIVKNSDPVMHNVHAMPAAGSGNKEENKGQMQGAPDLIFTFPAPEVYLIFSCNVHPWMLAYACVVDHPYFAVTDKDGKYTIKNVPDGKYTMEVYHRKAAPKATPITVEVQVSAGNVTKDFALEAK